MAEEEDYAVKAARAWFSGKLAMAEREAAKSRHAGRDCAYCNAEVDTIKAEIGRLAAIIRKHVVEGSNQPCHHNGAHYPFCGHPDY